MSVSKTGKLLQYINYRKFEFQYLSLVFPLTVDLILLIDLFFNFLVAQG